MQANQSRNQLLASMDPRTFAAIDASIAWIELRARRVIGYAGVRADDVYFPTTAVLSLVRDLDDGARGEVASVGNEGVNALPLFFGADHLTARTIVLTSGGAGRMSAIAFIAATRDHADLHRIISGYAVEVIAAMERSIICARHHTISQQLAQWLLRNAERVGSEEFYFTHDLVAKLFGVRRATVTEAIGKFVRAGTVLAGRGRLVVLDREGLQAQACTCYR